MPSLALRILRADAPISGTASRWTLIVCGLAIEFGLLAMRALADWQEHVVEFIALKRLLAAGGVVLIAGDYTGDAVAKP